MKKFWFFFKRIILSFIVFLVVYGVAVFALPYIPSGHHQHHGNITLYILSNGVHTDIVVPTENEWIDWSTIFPAHYTQSQQKGQWLAIGWGDKGFYLNTPTWSDLRASTALRAISGMGGSALHVTYYSQIEPCQRCAKLQVSEQQYRQLIDFVKQTIQWQHGQSIPIASKILGANDAFYEAHGSYHLFYTCNTWASDALKAMNAKTAWWTITDRGILQHY